MAKNTQVQQRPERDYVNILLLGETGVGKSTFINAFANYLQYQSLSEAEQNKLVCLIPAKFTVTDEDWKQQLVTFMNDENEDIQLGNSSTQGAKPYVFPFDNKMIRLIDTPGIGDARGVEKDNENFDSILQNINQYSHLHAICFLFKPDVTVINAYFRFCICELLSRLDRSAARNLVFLFTNTRATDYKATDTMTNLRRLLDEVKQKVNVDIHLQYSKGAPDNNVFCFDNAGFKYLVAKQQKIKGGDPQIIQMCWDVSYRSSWNLINYIMGDVDNNRPPLPPLKVQNIVSVNEARRLIVELAKPLADISELIQDNMSLLEKHNARILQDNISIDELKKSLHVPVASIKQTTLSQPVTICAASKCSEVRTVGGLKKYHYKQRCHNPCYLTNVPREIVGASELRSCAAMNGTNTCTQCKCDFTAHMHIYYETETVIENMEDTSIKTQIHTNEEKLTVQYQMVQNLNRRHSEFQREHKVISQAMAKFAHFLKHNSICPINDAYEAYLDYLIQREKIAFGANPQLLKRYEALKREHIEQKCILESAMAQANNMAQVTANDVVNIVADLFGLKQTGKHIKDLHRRLTVGKRREMVGNTTEYVHPDNAKIPKKNAPKAKSPAKSQPGKKQNKNSLEVAMELLQSNNKREGIRHLQKYINELEEEVENDNTSTRDASKPNQDMVKQLKEMLDQLCVDVSDRKKEEGAVPKPTTWNRGGRGGRGGQYNHQQARSQNYANRGHNNAQRGQYHYNRGAHNQQQSVFNQPGPYNNHQQQQQQPFPRPQQGYGMPMNMNFPPNHGPLPYMQYGPPGGFYPPQHQQQQQQQPPQSLPLNINVNIPSVQQTMPEQPPIEPLMSKYLDPPPSYNFVPNSGNGQYNANRGNRGGYRGGNFNKPRGNQSHFKNPSPRKPPQQAQRADDAEDASDSDGSFEDVTPVTPRAAPPNEEKQKLEKMKKFLDEQRRIAEDKARERAGETELAVEAERAAEVADRHQSSSNKIDINTLKQFFSVFGKKH